MPFRHVLLAVLAAALWGGNKLAIHYSLEQFPPLLLVVMRFLPLALIAVALVPWPRVRVKHLLLFGLGTGTVQLLGLYLGLAAGFPVGLAALVLSAAAPFTVLLGRLFLGEKLSARSAGGVGLALVGLGLVGAARGEPTALIPFLLVVLGALGWAFGNLAARQARTSRPAALVMWMSVVPPIPMLAASLLLEGPEEVVDALATSGTAEAIPAWLGVGYTILLGTVMAPVIWVWLMRRHPAGAVAPYSLLVPVVGMLAAWAALGEEPQPAELAGSALVLAGVVFGTDLRLSGGSGQPERQ